LQQRSNESAFFGQKRFRADEARVVSGAVVIAVGGENRCAHRERARRFNACYARFADCGYRFLLPPETKTG
jgi:hypothetical protein